MQATVRGYALELRTYVMHGPLPARPGHGREAGDIRRDLAEYQRLAATQRQRDRLAASTPDAELGGPRATRDRGPTAPVRSSDLSALYD